MPIFLDGMEDEVFLKPLHVHKLRSLFFRSMKDVFIINAKKLPCPLVLYPYLYFHYITTFIFILLSLIMSLLRYHHHHCHHYHYHHHHHDIIMKINPPFSLPKLLNKVMIKSSVSMFARFKLIFAA